MGESTQGDAPLEPFGSDIDLSNCAREPIHTPDHVKPHGALLVVDPASWRVVQVSENIDQRLGREVAQCLDQPLSALLPEPAWRAVRAWAEDSKGGEPPGEPPRRVYGGALHGAKHDLVVHRRGDWVVLELQPHVEGLSALGAMESFQAMLAGLASVQGLRPYCQALAERLRTVTGFDRVMIYRFAPEGHGWVFAEARDAALSPFLDLYYPESDIPAQARRMLLVNRTNLLPDAGYAPVGLAPPRLPDGTPLDMTFVHLRGVSRMHTEYLANMGVVATWTLALVVDGRLWGLIACHHNRSPLHLSHGVRVAGDLLAQAVSTRIEGLRRADLEAEAAELAGRRQRALLRLGSGNDVSFGIAASLKELREVVPCGGFAVLGDQAPLVSGAVPPPGVLDAIVGWLDDQVAGVVAEDRLPESVPEVAPFAEVAAGLLAVSTQPAVRGWLVWFRSERTRQRKWAGDPHKSVVVGPLGARLTPRTSFALWVEEVRGTSEPWSGPELESVGNLRDALSTALFGVGSLIRHMPSPVLTLRCESERARRKDEADGASGSPAPPPGSLVLLRANGAADRVFGVQTSTQAGLALEAVLPQWGRPELMDALRDTAEGGAPLRVLERAVAHKPDRVGDALADDSQDERVHELLAYQTAPGEVTVVLQDITERLRLATQQAEARLLASHNDRLRDLNEQLAARIAEVEYQAFLLDEAMTQSATGAWEWSLGDDRLRFSPQWLAIHGVSVAPPDLSAIAAAYHEEDRPRWHTALERARSGQSFAEDHMRIVRADTGEVRVTKVSGAPVRNRTGGLEKVVGFAQDVTDRAEAMRILERSNRDLESFSYAISHDLKAPLRGIRLAAGWLREDLAGELSSLAADHLTLIETRAQRLTAMIDGVLAYARAQQVALASEPIALGEVVEEVLAELQIGTSVRLRCEGTWPQVRCDRVQVRRVLTNLVDNAIKYHDRPGGSVVVRGDTPAHACRVWVTDDGPGLDGRMADRVFGLFGTVSDAPNEHSTGVGLALCKTLVERWGGAIGFEPASPRGTAFWFTVPAALTTLVKGSEHVDGLAQNR